MISWVRSLREEVTETPSFTGPTGVHSSTVSPCVHGSDTPFVISSKTETFKRKVLRKFIYFSKVYNREHRPKKVRCIYKNSK